MDGAVDDLSNSGNLERKRHISQDITYMWSLKRDTKDADVPGNRGASLLHSRVKEGYQKRF